MEEGMGEENSGNGGSFQKTLWVGGGGRKDFILIRCKRSKEAVIV